MGTSSDKNITRKQLIESFFRVNGQLACLQFLVGSSNVCVSSCLTKTFNKLILNWIHALKHKIWSEKQTFELIQFWSMNWIHTLNINLKGGIRRTRTMGREIESKDKRQCRTRACVFQPLWKKRFTESVAEPRKCVTGQSSNAQKMFSQLSPVTWTPD